MSSGPGARRRRLEPLDDRLGEHVERQVVWAARLGVGAAHPKATEGLDPYQGARNRTVEVDVAGPELAAGEVQMLAGLGGNAAGQPVGVVVGDAQRVVEVAGLYDGEDG